MAGFFVILAYDGDNVKSIKVTVGAKELSFPIEKANSKKENFFKFESVEKSDKVKFTLVFETEKKDQKSGAAFQVMGTLDESVVPKDLSSVDALSYAGCTSSEAEAGNSCASGLTGLMLDNNKNMFFTKADSET